MSVARARILRVAVALLCTQLAAGCASTSAGKRDLPPVGAGPEAHRKEATDLLRLLNMERNLEQMLDRTLELHLQTEPELRPLKDVMRAFLAKYMSWQSLEEDFVRMYMATFTAQELRDLADFYRTPTGQKALATMPTLFEQGGKLGQQRVQAHVGELQEMVQARLRELQADEDE